MIIITGASGGLGNYLVKKLKNDHELIGTYWSHKPDKFESTVDFYQLDVSNAQEIDSFMKKISPKLHNIVFIHLAGISINAVSHKMKEEYWDRVMDVNLKGAFLMTRSLIPIMRMQEWGRVIYISSVVGQTGIPGTCAYSASKAGLFGLTRTVAAENVLKNITVNTISLGYFNVGIIDTLNPDMQEQIKEKIPMRRFGRPENFEMAIRFLIDCDYITGSILNINGGFLY